MWGSRSVVIIIDHFLFQIPCRPSVGATMGTEPDIFKKNRYVTRYDLATTQIISLIYPVMFQVVPEPRRDHHGSWPASRNHASTLIIQSFIHYLPPGSNQSALPVGDFTHPWRRRTDAWLRYGTLQPATLF